MQSLAIISDSEEGVEGGAAPGPPGAAKDLDHMDLASRCCPLYVTEKEGAKKMALSRINKRVFHTLLSSIHPRDAVPVI